MSLLDSRVPVGQLVAERLGRARLFDRLGIDYCCGGQKPLDRACREKGLDVDRVLHALETADIEARAAEHEEWGTAPLGALVDHIVTRHHGYLRRELPRLTRYAEKVARVHGARHPELLELNTIVADLAEDMDSHMNKEERVLFPMIKQLEAMEALPSTHPGGIHNPIHAMEHEHDDAGAALKALRRLSGDYTPPGDACMTYKALLDGLANLESDLHRHVHKENNILFPRALALEAELLTGAGRREGE